MSNMYTRIEELCKKNLINVSEMCRLLKIGRSSLSELSRGASKKLNAKSTAKISEFFKVSPSYLIDGIPDEINEHFIRQEDREDVKQFYRGVAKQYPSISLEQGVEAELKVFECLFSRSYESQGFDPRHISFNAYVALLLGQKHFKERIHPDIYNALNQEFGSKSGMQEGTTYALINPENLSGKKPPVLDEGLIKKNSTVIVLNYGGDEQEVVEVSKEDMDLVKALAETIKKRREKEQQE